MGPLCVPTCVFALALPSVPIFYELKHQPSTPSQLRIRIHTVIHIVGAILLQSQVNPRKPTATDRTWLMTGALFSSGWAGMQIAPVCDRHDVDSPFELADVTHDMLLVQR